VIVLGIIVSVHPTTPARIWEIRRIAVNHLVSRETLRGEEVNRITLDIAGERGKEESPASNDCRISVDSDTLEGQLLVPQDRASSEVRLYVHGVWRKQIDDVLIALTFSARIPHVTIIVSSGDDVNGSTNTAHLRSYSDAREACKRGVTKRRKAGRLVRLG
jgi:hypothetical protein